MKIKNLIRVVVALLSALTLISSISTKAYATDIVKVGNGPTPPDVHNAVAVSAGGGHMIALLADGTTVGSGGPFTDNRANPFTKADLASYGATKVVKICAGNQHSTYWLDNGCVVSRGLNTGNRVGVFPFSGVNPASGYTIIDVTAGRNFSAVAYYYLGSNYITVWGDIYDGVTTPRQIQSSNINASLKPWNNTMTVSKISGGSSHLIWIMNNGTAGVVTGVGFPDGIIPASASYNSGFTQVSAGNLYTLYQKGTTMHSYGVNHAYFSAGERFGVVEVSAGVAVEAYRFINGTASAKASSSPQGSLYGQNVAPVGISKVISVSAADTYVLYLTDNPPVLTNTVVSSTATTKTIRVEWDSARTDFNIVQVSSDLSPWTTVSPMISTVSGKFRADVTVDTTQSGNWYVRVKRSY